MGDGSLQWNYNQYIYRGDNVNPVIDTAIPSALCPNEDACVYDIDIVQTWTHGWRPTKMCVRRCLSESCVVRIDDVNSILWTGKSTGGLRGLSLPHLVPATKVDLRIGQCVDILPSGGGVSVINLTGAHTVTFKTGLARNVLTGIHAAAVLSEEAFITSACRLSPFDGNFAHELAVGTSRGRLGVVARQQCTEVFNIQNSITAMTGGHSVVYAGTSAGSVSAVDLRSADVRVVLQSRERVCPIVSLSMSGDNKYLLLCYRDSWKNEEYSGVWLYDVHMNRPVHSVNLPRHFLLHGGSFVKADPSRFVVMGRDGSWSCQKVAGDPEPWYAFSNTQGPIRSYSVSAFGTSLSILDNQGMLTNWNHDTDGGLTMLDVGTSEICEALHWSNGDESAEGRGGGERMTSSGSDYTGRSNKLSDTYVPATRSHGGRYDDSRGPSYVNEGAYTADLEGIPRNFARNIPPRREVENKATKPVNVDDVKCRLVGLQHNPAMPYLNPLLLLLSYIMPFRGACKYHACESESCLPCESGFLFHMLDVATCEEDVPYCQPANYIDAYLKMPETASLRLLTPQLHDEFDVDRKLEGCWSLMLANMAMGAEPNQVVSTPGDALYNALGMHIELQAKCVHGHSSVQKRVEYSLQLTYPSNPVGVIDVLSAPLSQSLSLRSHCNECKQTVKMDHTRRMAPNGPLPLRLTFCTKVQNSAHRSFWARSKTLPLKIYMSNDRQSLVDNGEGYADYTEYELVHAVYRVSSIVPHCVLMTRIPMELVGTSDWRSHSFADGALSNTWILFNDSRVVEIPKHTVTDLTCSWRYPLLLTYQRRGSEIKFRRNTTMSPLLIGDRLVPPPVHRTPIPFEVFCKDENMSRSLVNKGPSFTPLNPSELEKLHRDGLYVAMDSEFVALKADEDPEELSFRPSNLCLGRVSVIRAEGPQDGIPIIDHYIRSTKVPEDYLTRYSGIKHGDLDEAVCQHWLTTKKSVYCKLRYLVDNGCRFIGHGLAKDLQIINIIIPSNQIIDTVKLYKMPSGRYVSLRFLAAHILHRSIQDGAHDSVTDALAALALYRRYLELNSEQMFDEALKYLLDVGSKTNWKYPS